MRTIRGQLILAGSEELPAGDAGKGAQPTSRMFTARATTRTPTTTEIASAAIIMSFAHALIAETSVGLNDREARPPIGSVSGWAMT